MMHYSIKVKTYKTDKSASLAWISIPDDISSYDEICDLCVDSGLNSGISYDIVECSDNFPFLPNSFEIVVEVIQILTSDNKDAFIAFINYFGNTEWTEFTDRYIGKFFNVEDWVDHWLELTEFKDVKLGTFWLKEVLDYRKIASKLSDHYTYVGNEDLGNGFYVFSDN
jgi:hypothetical protein